MAPPVASDRGERLDSRGLDNGRSGRIQEVEEARVGVYRRTSLLYPPSDELIGFLGRRDAPRGRGRYLNIRPVPIGTTKRHRRAGRRTP